MNVGDDPRGGCAPRTPPFLPGPGPAVWGRKGYLNPTLPGLCKVGHLQPRPIQSPDRACLDYHFDFCPKTQSLALGPQHCVRMNVHFQGLCCCSCSQQPQELIHCPGPQESGWRRARLLGASLSTCAASDVRAPDGGIHLSWHRMTPTSSQGCPVAGTEGARGWKTYAVHRRGARA